MDVGPVGGASAAQAANVATPQKNTQSQPAEQEVPLAEETIPSEDNLIGTQLDVSA